MSYINGNIAEIQFLLEATKKGLLISKPQSSYSVYDYIVDNGKKMLKLQIKSCFLNGPRFGTNVCKGKSVKKSYTKDDCDIIIIFIAKHLIWFFIPVEELLTIKKITLLLQH